MRVDRAKYKCDACVDCGRLGKLGRSMLRPYNGLPRLWLLSYFSVGGDDVNLAEV